jgi:N-acetylmuramoyl-L-alanine amidase
MNKILYIDAGHGGLDSKGSYMTPAHIGKYFDHGDKAKFHKKGMFYEGVWNRSFALKFIEKATKKGFICVPVFHPEKDTRLGDRVDIANKVSEKFNNEGTYLSFHSNAANSKARGFNLFYHPNSNKGKNIATAIVKNINDLFIANGSVNKFPLREGYMNVEKTAIFYVLAATNMPSLLFEFGFFDNLQDAKLIFDIEFQDKLAEILVNSLSTAELF